MEYIVHLTDRCNLRCKYCYEHKENKDISFDEIKKLIDLELKQNEEYSVINFYGGEPLIKKDLIKETIDYINANRGEREFYYAVTTNGTLLDDDFLKFMKENQFVNVCYSIDGDEKPFNKNRLTIEEKPVFDIVNKNAKKILAELPNVVANIVLTQNNIEYFSDSIKYIVSLGFKGLNIMLDSLCDWNREDLIELRKQLNEVADLYVDMIIKEENVHIYLLDEKLRANIDIGVNCNKNCKLGLGTINVGTDGNFYPCMQFVGDEKYIIGNCNDGIDIVARNKLRGKAFKENDKCKNCAINRKCTHTCACVNYMTTGDINGVSPKVCETEKIIVDVADIMTEKLRNSNYDALVKHITNNT